MKRLKITQPECWLNVLVILAFGILIAMLVSACSPSGTANANDNKEAPSTEVSNTDKTTVEKSAIQVSDPYARAVPPNTPASAVFLTLTNNGDVEQKLVSASSDVANVVELHTHVEKDGMMQMRKIDAIDIPANGTTTLKPGGLHIMLIQLKQALEVDSMIPVTLTFEDGSEQALNVPVRKINSMMKKHH